MQEVWKKSKKQKRKTAHTCNNGNISKGHKGQVREVLMTKDGTIWAMWLKSNIGL
jgi:hypothetical protein